MPGALRFVVVLAALVATLLIAASGPGTRLGWWDFRTGFVLMRWAMYVGFTAAVLAVILVAIPGTRTPSASVLVVAIVLGVMAGAPAIGLRTRAQSLPYIHDISTDTGDPPAFVALEAARKAAPNGLAYGGPEVAAAQAKGYPDIRPLVVSSPPTQAFGRALDAARAMGWEVASSEAASGRIEATATTTWYGFKDDVVVRIRPEGAGSRIDVRSMSRVGKSDVGANASRIRQYLAKLA